MANQKPRITSVDQTVVANEKLKGADFISAVDPDNDPIVRYQIFHRKLNPGTNVHGYFELNGVMKPADERFKFDAADLQNLVFVSAAIGQRPSSVDAMWIRAYDGQEWGAAKRITVRTLHNRYRPVITPQAQSLLSGNMLDAMDLFTVSDEDGSTVKRYQFRDLDAGNDSAYLLFKGVNMQGSGWFDVLPEEMDQLKLVAGDRGGRDRIRIRATDGRLKRNGVDEAYGAAQNTFVTSLERPFVSVDSPVIFNELVRESLDDLISDGGSSPPISHYQVVDLNGDATSGRLRKAHEFIPAGEVMTIAATDMDQYDFEGGLYDLPSRDGMAIRAYNGQFWSAWDRLEFLTEPYYIDAFNTDEDWNQYLPPPDFGEPLEITYSFLQAVPTYYPSGSDVQNGFARLNTVTRANIRNHLDELAEIIDVRFIEVSDVVGGTIRFGSYNAGPGSPGNAELPTDHTLNEIGGDVWLNNFVNPLAIPPIDWIGTYENNSPGALGPAWIRNFLGRAMGLGDPSIPNPAPPLLPESTSDQRYSVMNMPTLPSGMFRHAESWQLYDIAALQDLYGENKSVRLGDDTYSFGVDRHVAKTILDKGGDDTIDVSNQTTAATIDLRQGAFSTFGRQWDFFFNEWRNSQRNVAIAFGTDIEHARGSSFGDNLTGNDLDNTLNGLGGNDWLNGLGGDDYLMGGAGNDTYHFDLFGDHDIINDNDANSIDVLEIHSHTADLEGFTKNLLFRQIGDDLMISLTLNENNGRDLVDGSVRIADMTGTNGVETLRLIGPTGANIEGVDIDLTSVYAKSTDQNQRLAITATDGTYGKLVANI